MSITWVDDYATTKEVTSPRARRGKRHIVLAEDNSEMRAMLALALSHEGYNVIECGNGEELSLCLSESDYRNSEAIDLVISDIRMPLLILSGIEVLRQYGRKPRCPPMILMTAFGDSAGRHAAQKLGAVAFFDKPFGLDDLIRKVREIAPP